MKISAIALLLALATPAHAEEPPPVRWTVGAHLYTYHFDTSQGFNNVNPGLYVVRNDWAAGAYYNSERRASVYAGYVFRQLLGSPIDITVGAVTGYERQPVLPLVVPSVAWRGFRVSLLLPFDKSGSAVHFSYEVDL